MPDSNAREKPESLIIRPPSEWRSLLIRATRGCHWNRCRFCGIYPALGEPDFSVRSVDEVKHDIDLLRRRDAGLDLGPMLGRVDEEESDRLWVEGVVLPSDGAV